MSDLEIVTRLKHSGTPLPDSGEDALYALGSGGEGEPVETDDGYLGLAPVGTLFPWIDSLGAVSAPAPDSHYLRLCDGTTMSGGNACAHSIWNGKTLPSLSGKFLRGVTGSTGGTGGGSSHSHSISIGDFPTTEVTLCGGSSGKYMLSNNSGTVSTSSASTEPPYYEVRYYLRIY